MQTVFYRQPLRRTTLKTPLGILASPASGPLPPRLAARRGTAYRGLDIWHRMGDAEDSRVSRCEGLGTARPWEKRGGAPRNRTCKRFAFRTDRTQGGTGAEADHCP